MTIATAAIQQDQYDRIAVWPDGGYADIEDVHRGEYASSSDDYEVVSLGDLARLRDLGLDELIEPDA